MFDAKLTLKLLEQTRLENKHDIHQVGGPISDDRLQDSLQYMTEPYYLFSVDVILESLIVWPKFQQLVNLLKMYMWFKSQPQEMAVNTRFLHETRSFASRKVGLMIKKYPTQMTLEEFLAFMSTYPSMTEQQEQGLCWLHVFDIVSVQRSLLISPNSLKRPRRCYLVKVIIFQRRPLILNVPTMTGR